MFAIVKITIRELLFRMEQLAVFGVGVLFVVLFGIFYLSDTLAEQALSMAAVSSPGGIPPPRDILVSTMFLFGEFFITITAFFTIPQLIAGDEQQKTLPLFLSKPKPRWHYFFGKYIGGTATLCISFGAYALIILLFVLVQSPSLFATLIVSSLFVVFKLALLSALILGFAERFYMWFGAIIALLYYVAGHVTVRLPEWSNANQWLGGGIIKAAHYILPNLTEVSSWSFISASVEHYPIHINYVYWFIKQIGIYTLGSLFLGYMSFKKKSL